MIFNAVEVVKQATGKVSAPDLQRFIATAAMSPGQIATPEWQAQFHNQCLKAAWEKDKTPTGAHDYELAKEFWLGEYPSMADKTRSSIATGVNGILHVFNTGVVRELVSTTTNVTPDDMFAGKWVLIDMSPAEWGDIGNFVCAGWKYLTQRAVLRRHAGERGHRPGDVRQEAHGASRPAGLDQAATRCGGPLARRNRRVGHESF